LFEEGSKAFTREDYPAAIQAFTRAYEASSRPALLFNIAQAYRKSGECRHAAEFYRRFLERKEDVTIQDRAKIERWITEMDACKEAPSNQEAPPTTRSNIALTATLTASSEGPRILLQGPPSIQEERPRATHWLPWVLGGAGVLSAGTGATLFVTTLNDVNGCRPDCEPNHVSHLKTRAAAADIMLGIGAVAVVAGVTLALFDLSRDAPSNPSESGALAVTPDP
jgi:hypothetical protein